MSKNTRQDGVDVLVVGAGPVGLTAALECAERGLSVRIVDKKAERSLLAKAVGVNARSLDLLDASGATDRLIAAGRKTRRVALFSGRRRAASLDWSVIRHRFPFMLAIPQAETERILEDLLAERGISVERGTTLSAVEQDPDAVAATLKTAGGHEFHEIAAYVIGADGGHSTVRDSLDIGFTGAVYPNTWSAADARLDWPFDDDAIGIMGAQNRAGTAKPGSVLFAIRLPDQRFRVIANVPDVLSLLPDPIRVAGVDWTDTFHVHLRMVDRFGAGRIWLAGDAAHQHSPAGGRGMNLGIEDACRLAGAISTGRLEAYSRDRHAAGARVLAETDRMFRAARMAGPITAWLRDRLLAMMVHRPRLMRRFLEMNAGLA